MHVAAGLAEKRLALAVLVSVVVHAGVLANMAGGRIGYSAPSSQLMTVRLSDPESAGAPEAVAPPAPPQKAPALERAAAPQSGTASPSPSEALIPALEHYYRGSEVDVRAEPLSLPDVQYPEEALARNIEGRVVMRLLIDRSGRLREATLLEADPPGVFDDAALRAVRSLSFKPAQLGGRDVASIKLIEIPFFPDCRRTGSCVQGAR